ncbi:MAG: acetate--CoA ligase family protein [Blastocatellia bacterium]|nr:acetate--CoA ligase family protein [Blastocatellia bacterium]
MTHPLDCIFDPRGIAIVGASHNKTKRGYQAVRALQEAGYKGRIYPVNPKGGELLGLHVAKSIAEIEGDPELALVCAPARAVPEILEDCAAKGIRAAVVLALGFRESGEQGAALEAEISEIVRRTGIRVVGPNTSGVLNLPKKLNLVGARGVRTGNLALLAQSGNMTLALITQATARSNQGFSVVVGVGNQTDIAYHEYLEYLETDPHTTAVLMCVEGFQDGQKFLETARRVTPKKPIILLKMGRSKAGRASAKSHTGAIAGSYPVLHSALKQVGVIEVTRTDEQFHVGETLARQPEIKAGLGVAILSDGGGHATVATDSLAEAGVPLARLSEKTQDRLREILSPAANVAGPVDVAGAADMDPCIFIRCIEALMEDEGVGGVLWIGLFGGYHIRFAEELVSAEEETAAEVLKVASSAGKPLVVHSLYARKRSEPVRILSRGGVPVVESLNVACRCITAAYERGQFLSRRLELPAVEIKPAWRGFDAARREGRRALLLTEATDLVREYDISIAPSRLCASAAEAAHYVEETDGRVALKVVSAAISHKTDAGGVLLNIREAEEARSGFDQIRQNAAEYADAHSLNHDFEGVLASPMLPQPLAEVIVGIKRNSQYGLVLMFGLGGIAVEVLRDVVLRILPISRADALEMIDQIKAAPLLRGLRGRPPVDYDALVDLMMGLADCAMSNPDIAELELNPVFAYADRAVAVDVRAFLKKPSREASVKA